MKKVFLMVMLVLALTLNYSFAQMGGGMMGGQEDTKGHTQDMKAQKGMMTPEKTQEQMKDMTNQMSDMMRNMAGKMKDMKTDELTEMTKIMQDMSKQLQDMSTAMGQGWGYAVHLVEHQAGGDGVRADFAQDAAADFQLGFVGWV